MLLVLHFGKQLGVPPGHALALKLTLAFGQAVGVTGASQHRAPIGCALRDYRPVVCRAAAWKVRAGQAPGRVPTAPYTQYHNSITAQAVRPLIYSSAAKPLAFIGNPFPSHGGCLREDPCHTSGFRQKSRIGNPVAAPLPARLPGQSH